MSNNKPVTSGAFKHQEFHFGDRFLHNVSRNNLFMLVRGILILIIIEAETAESLFDSSFLFVRFFVCLFVCLFVFA